MRQVRIVAAFIVSIVGPSRFASAQVIQMPGPDEAVLYEHSCDDPLRAWGWQRHLDPAGHNPDDFPNDAASSISTGTNVRARVCKDDNGGPPCQDIPAGVECQKMEDHLNDQISWVEVARVRDPGSASNISTDDQNPDDGIGGCQRHMVGIGHDVRRELRPKKRCFLVVQTCQYCDYGPDGALKGAPSEACGVCFIIPLF